MKQVLTGLLLASLLAAGPVLANDTSISLIGGVPRVQFEKQIEMQAEKLEFRFVPPAPAPEPVNKSCPKSYFFDEGVCKGGEPHWQADHRYTFVNHGPDRTLTIGLPFALPDCEAGYDFNGPCVNEGVSQLTTSVDGINQPVSIHKVKLTQPFAFNRLYTVEVPFKAGQTRVLRHRYQSYSISSVEGQRFYYLLRTGSTWAGPIGKVEIDFELPPNQGPCVTANLPHRYDGHWLKIRLTKWKPDRDLNLVFVDRERALLGSEVALWGYNHRDICEDALRLPLSERKQIADRIELLYGRPSKTVSDAQILAQGPIHFCRSSYYFQSLLDKEPDFMPHPELNLRYLSDQSFPNNLPIPLKQCLNRLRQTD